MAMMNIDPDWKAIRSQNKKNLDVVADGKSIFYLAVGEILLVGSGVGHVSVRDFVVHSTNPLRGTIKVDKATNHGIIDRGTLTVSSSGKGERAIAAELRQISNKNIQRVAQALMAGVRSGGGPSRGWVEPSSLMRSAVVFELEKPMR